MLHSQATLFDKTCQSLEVINAFLQYPFDIGDPVDYLKLVNRISSII